MNQLKQSGFDHVRTLMTHSVSTERVILRASFAITPQSSEKYFLEVWEALQSNLFIATNMFLGSVECR